MAKLSSRFKSASNKALHTVRPNESKQRRRFACQPKPKPLTLPTLHPLLLAGLMSLFVPPAPALALALNLARSSSSSDNIVLWLEHALTVNCLLQVPVRVERLSKLAMRSGNLRQAVWQTSRRIESFILVSVSQPPSEQNQRLLFLSWQARARANQVLAYFLSPLSCLCLSTANSGAHL